MEIPQEYVDRIRSLFYIQSDYYAEGWYSKKQDKAGYSPACAHRFDAQCKAHNYHCNDCTHCQLLPLSDTAILNHLQGKKTLGAYQVYADRVLWLCLDFDIEDEAARRNALEFARLVWAELDHLNVPAYLEDSGNKGYHLWVFFSERVMATLAQELGVRLVHKLSTEQHFAGVNPVEVFPKQTKVTETDFGNLVKVPFGLHPKTGRRCVFLAPDGTPLPDQRAVLLAIRTLPAVDLPAIVAEFAAVPQRAVGMENRQVTEVILQGERDRTLTSIAGTLRRKGLTPEEIEAALRIVNERRCEPPLDEQDVRKIARSVGRYEPQAQGVPENTPHYILDDGGITYVKPKPIIRRNQDIEYDYIETPVCNFEISIAAELQSCDGEESENMFSLHGRTSDRPFLFDIAAEELADPRKLQAALLVNAGGKGIVYAGQMRHMLPAIQWLSNGYQREVRYVSTGWQRVGDRWIFVTPGGGIGIDLVRCDVAAELRNYRLASNDADLTPGLQALTHLLAAFEHDITYPALAHAFLAPLLRFLPNVKRYCLHLTGETGSLKTTFATLLLCLFGDFGNEDPTAKFGSTVNSIEVLGHQAKDVLFVVDDFKPRIVKLEDITRLIQGYSDGHGRGRLNRNATLQTTKYVRGVLLTTGEDVPENEASIIARSLILKMSRWDGRNDHLASAAELSRALPDVMSSFIEWLLRDEQRELETLLTTKRDKFLMALAGQGITNAGRIATNAAQNWLAFKYFTDWLGAYDLWSAAQIADARAEHDEILAALCGQMAQRVQAEKSSVTFVEAVQAMLASGEAVIIERQTAARDVSGDFRLNTDVPPGKTLLGWKDDAGVYMHAETAFHEIERWYRQIGKSIGQNANSLWDQLRADGFIIERSIPLKTGQGQHRVIHFSRDILEQVKVPDAPDALDF